MILQWKTPAPPSQENKEGRAKARRQLCHAVLSEDLNAECCALDATRLTCRTKLVQHHVKVPLKVQVASVAGQGFQHCKLRAAGLVASGQDLLTDPSKPKIGP